MAIGGGESSELRDVELHLKKKKGRRPRAFVVKSSSKFFPYFCVCRVCGLEGVPLFFFFRWRWCIQVTLVIFFSCVFPPFFLPLEFLLLLLLFFWIITLSRRI